MYIMTSSTRNFEFMTSGKSIAECRAVLQTLIETHCQQRDMDYDPNYWRSVIDDANYINVYEGQGFIDGERIELPKVRRNRPSKMPGLFYNGRR